MERTIDVACIHRSLSSAQATAASLDVGDEGFDPRAGVGAVENALRLLQLYRQREALGVSETARLLGVGRSTAHRLLPTLLAHGFVIQDGSRAYRVGPALRELGAAIAE